MHQKTADLPPLAPDIAAMLQTPPKRQMDFSELPPSYLTPCLPTTRPVRNIINGKLQKPKWQAVVFIQRGAHEHIRLLWSSHDLYEDRDEAQDVAQLRADRLAVAEYLDDCRSAAAYSRNSGVGVPEQPDLAQVVEEQQRNQSFPPTG